MTTASEGAELTQVGPGTTMGALMREYWMPALKSSELERDGPPVRFMLLGEKLIAFRDSDGRVGVMDHRCPHRCASLFLGRNEEGGLRCLYHGWKFDVTGQCIDMPSVPPQQDFKHKVHAKAYRTPERAGLVWVYMGARAEAPPLPALQILDAPDGEINVGMIQRDCNYLQAIEGEIDTAHFGYLHGGHADPARLDESEPFYYTVTNRAPQLPRHRRAVGHAVRRATARPGRPDLLALRQLPVSVLDAGAERRVRQPRARPRLGADRRPSTRCTSSSGGSARSAANSLPQPAYKDGTPIGGTGRGNKLLPNTTDWLGRWRMADSEANDWGMDREAQRTNRSTAASTASTCRTRRSPRAWGRSSTTRSSTGPVGPDDHPHPAAAADGGARAARRGHLAARRRGRQASITARAAAISSATTGSWQDVYERGSPRPSIRRRRPCAPPSERAIGVFALECASTHGKLTSP